MADQIFVAVLARHPLQAAGDLPGQRLEQLVARGQRADGDQVEILQLPAVAFVLAQLELADLDLRAEGEAIGVIGEVMVGHAQAVLGEGAVIAAADAELPGP